MSGISLNVYLIVLLFIIVLLFFLGTGLLLAKIANGNFERINSAAANFFFIVNITLAVLALAAVITASVYGFSDTAKEHVGKLKKRITTEDDQPRYGYLIAGLVVCILFLSLFVANAVFLGKIRKIIIEQQSSIGSGLITGFWAANVIMSVLVSGLLIYLSYLIHKYHEKQREEKEIGERRQKEEKSKAEKQQQQAQIDERDRQIAAQYHLTTTKLRQIANQAGVNIEDIPNLIPEGSELNLGALQAASLR